MHSEKRPARPAHATLPACPAHPARMRLPLLLLLLIAACAAICMAASCARQRGGAQASATTELEMPAISGISVRTAPVGTDPRRAENADVQILLDTDREDETANTCALVLAAADRRLLWIANEGAEAAEFTFVFPSDALTAESLSQEDAAVLQAVPAAWQMQSDRLLVSVPAGTRSALVLTARAPVTSFTGITLRSVEETVCYAADAAYLQEALSSALTPPASSASPLRLLLTADITVPDGLTIPAPCTLSLNGRRLRVPGTLLFETDAAGALHVEGGAGLSVGAFYAQAPACRICTDFDFFDFDGQMDYYMQVLAYNGTELDPEAVTVRREAALRSLADAQALPRLRSGMTVILAGDLTLSEPVEITVPVSLRVEGALTAEAPLQIVTRERGAISITAGVDSGVSPDAIRIDAPLCALSWEGAGAPSLEEAAELLNVETYNGASTQPYGLGGTGTGQVLSFSLERGGAAALPAPLYWTVRGNLIELWLSYLVSDRALRACTPEVAVSEGCTAHFTGEAPDHALADLMGEHELVVTDAAGGTRTYRVRTQRITYRLPVVYINVEGDAAVLSREEYLRATVSVDCRTADGAFPSLPETEVSIRGRGHYSWTFNKKPYKLHFDKKTSVLGMRASKNWVLLSNYVDRSLIQNHVALEMGKTLSYIPYHTTQYPVDVFVNGVYRGVYTMGEQIEAKAERLNLEESYTDPDTDYLLEVGGSDDGDVYKRDYFHAGTLRFVAIKHPDSTRLTAEQLAFIQDYVLQADTAVRTLTDYERYIDVDSLIDWVILHELTYNLDCCFRRSCYLIKEKGGKLKMGPVWDFDLAFGSFYRYREGTWATVGAAGEYVGVTWMNYLLEDPAFTARFRQR